MKDIITKLKIVNGYDDTIAIIECDKLKEVREICELDRIAELLTATTEERDFGECEINVKIIILGFTYGSYDIDLEVLEV